MRVLVIAVLVLGGAGLGCGDGAGPAMPPFGPFGNDPSNAVSEPPGGAVETPPSSGGGQSIAQLCATDCARIAAACPPAADAGCVSGCEAEPQMYPACTAQLQDFLTCYESATLTCNGTSAEATGCTGAAQVLLSCLSPGS